MKLPNLRYINNYTQNVESGGTGTFIPKKSKLEVDIMYLGMKYELKAVEAEINNIYDSFILYTTRNLFHKHFNRVILVFFSHK